jgi:outer membrane protein TolC
MVTAERRRSFMVSGFVLGTLTAGVAMSACVVLHVGATAPAWCPFAVTGGWGDWLRVVALAAGASVVSGALGAAAGSRAARIGMSRGVASRVLGFLLLAIAAAAGVPQPVGAQERRDTLDLPTAIAAARAQNPRIAGASAEVAAAGARIGPAGAWADPTVTLGAMNYMLPGLSPRRDPMSMNQLTVMQMLPVNGALGFRRAAARADSARVASGRDAMVLEIEHEVRTRYWELYHTDRALETMTHTLGVLRDLASIASAMYAVGSVTQADVVRAQLAITRMQQEIADMELQRYAAASALNALMGRPGETPVALRASGATEAHGGELHALDMPQPPSLDSLAGLAESGNPGLAALRAAVTAAQASETAARRMLLPDLGVGLSYGQRFGMNDMLSAMVTVSVPVFARSRQLRWRDEALAMHTASEQQLQAMRLDIRRDLATARAEAETARRQVALYAGALVPQATATYEASLAAYRVGRVDFMTVLDARMALLMYEHDIHRFEAMYGAAIADLDRLIGRVYVTPMPGME